jgi:DNA polymerase-1
MSEKTRLKTTIVPPAGDLNARILFIGEAPGQEEDLLGEPFIGSAGQFLRRALIQKGFDPQAMLFHNCFQQRPPDNNIGYFFNDKSCTNPTWEGQEHIEALRDWLKEVRARGELYLIVALGAIPLNVLTGKRFINKWRGSVLPCTLVEGLKVYATFHPSHVMRSMEEPLEGLSGEKKERTQNALPLFLIDLDRIKEEARVPELFYPKRVFETDLSFLDLINRIKRLNHEKLVACDIETLPGQEGQGPILWCIGFAPSPGQAFVVPFIKKLAPCWVIEQEAQLHQAISEVFLNPNVQKVFQNGSYDLAVLGRYFGHRVATGSQEDTMLCHHASYPYLFRSLAVLTSIYTKEPYYKDDGRNLVSGRGDIGEFLYNAKDCCVTREIFPIVQRHALELATWQGYQRTMRVQPSLLGMMIRGVRIDLERKKTLAREFAHKVKFYEEEIQRMLGRQVNLNSAPQKIKLLYGELGLKLQFNHITKKPTTDKDALQKLRRLYKGKIQGGLNIEELLTAMIERSKYGKLVANYTEMTIEPDGRARTSYTVISTMRLSSSESHFGGGGNLQNIPKRTSEGREIRKLFVPDPCDAFPPRPWSEIIKELTNLYGEEIAKAFTEGRKAMLAFDLSQAEARVVAWEAEDLARIELFENGWDVHWYNAQQIFSIPKEIVYTHETKNDEFIDHITEESHTLKDLRNIGKTAKHADNYGMGPKMLQTILAREGFILDFMTCRNILTKIKARDPQTRDWQRKIREQVQANRYLISSYGRKREFMGRMDETLYKSAYAFSPQNTVGELLCDAIQDIWEQVPLFEPLLNVHDEVVGQCNPWDLPAVIAQIKPLMERPLVINGRTLTIPTSVSIGRSWGELIEL